MPILKFYNPCNKLQTENKANRVTQSECLTRPPGISILMQAPSIVHPASREATLLQFRIPIFIRNTKDNRFLAQKMANQWYTPDRRGGCFSIMHLQTYLGGGEGFIFLKRFHSSDHAQHWVYYYCRCRKLVIMAVWYLSRYVWRLLSLLSTNWFSWFFSFHNCFCKNIFKT